MIARIVIMHFLPDAVSHFLTLFSEKEDFIRSFPGCLHLELFQMQSQPTIFMTYSIWQSEKDLENYRTSPLFQETWQATKKLFQAPPTAYSIPLFLSSQSSHHHTPDA